MINTRLIPVDQLCDMNTIGVKLVKQKRLYSTSVADELIEKEITRTRYLKVCCSCGTPYETYKYNSYACGYICRQNIIHRRKKGKNPLGNLYELTKPKNVREIKASFGYR